VVFTFLATFSDAQLRTAHFAHLGGLVVAALYLRFGAGQGGTPSILSRGPRLPRVAIMRQRSDARERTPAATPRAGRGERAPRGEGAEAELLDEVDRILDKISESGMASLTDQERSILDEVSRRRRSN
jgi:hypothetical protein